MKSLKFYSLHYSLIIRVYLRVSAVKNYVNCYFINFGYYELFSIPKNPERVFYFNFYPGFSVVNLLLKHPEQFDKKKRTTEQGKGKGEKPDEHL